LKIAGQNQSICKKRRQNKVVALWYCLTDILLDI